MPLYATKMYLMHRGAVRSEIHLDAVQAQSHYTRIVFFSDKLHKDLQAYARSIFTKLSLTMFYEQKNDEGEFTANTLC